MIASYRIRPGSGRRTLGFLLACLIFGANSAAWSAVITVNSTADPDTPDADECTLRDAIASANSDADQGQCTGDTTNGPYGVDTIQFDSSLVAVDDDGNPVAPVVQLSDVELVVDDAGDTPGETLTIDGEVSNPDDTDTVDVVIDGGGERDTSTDSDGNHCVADSRLGRLFDVQTPATLANLDLRNSCIENEDGGAIHNSSTLTLDDADISNANATSPDDTTGGRGGAIFNADTPDATLAISNGTTINGSFAAFSGGGIFNESTATTACAADDPDDDPDTEDNLPDQCTISLHETTTLFGNAAGRSETGAVVRGNGGGLYNAAGVVAGNGVSFTGSNSASVSGGGIWNAGEVYLLSATFQQNFARVLYDDMGGIAEAGGGAIFNAGGTLDIEFATFLGNIARTSTSEAFSGDPDQDHALGGAIASTGGPVTLDTVALTQNQAGRPEFEASDGTERVEIRGRGGALYASGGILTVSDSTFFGNLSQTDGGAIWNGSDDLEILRTTVQDNDARGGSEDMDPAFGGAGLYNEGIATIQHSRFTLNVANGDNSAGGGILNLAGGDLTIEDSDIGRNDATFGGGIDNGGTLNLTRVFLGAPQTESRNIASEEGGGLHNRAGASATIDDSTIAFNDGNDGGGIWNDGTLTVTNSTFSNNRALSSGDGGALFQAEAGGSTLSFITIAGNSADGSGAGVALAEAADPSQVTVESSILAGTMESDVSASNSVFNDSGVEQLKLSGGPLPTRPLGPDSDAIDTADDTACNNVAGNRDQRDAERPDGDSAGPGLCDSGSFERTDDPVLSVERNGPDETIVGLQDDDVNPGENLVVLAFSVTYESGEDNDVNLGGIRTRPLFNGGVEALRRLVGNDPEAELDFKVYRDVDEDGEFDEGQEEELGDDGIGEADFARTFTFNTSGDVNIPEGETEFFLVAVELPQDDADEDQSAALLSVKPILAGGALIGLLGLVRIRGLRRRMQWLLVVGLLTGGLVACSDSSSIDDIQPPQPPQPDPSLQGQLRFELRELTPGSSEPPERILIGDGLPVFGPRIGVGNL